MKIVLNIIGILIFFLNRLAGRKERQNPLSIRYWFRDNWEQLICVALVDIALMLLVVNGGLEFNFEKLTPMLPEGMKLAGDLALSFLVGLVFSWGVYVGYKKMFKTK